MKPIKLKINTKTQQYSIIIGSNLVSKYIKNFQKIIQLILKNVYLLLIKIFQKKLFPK